MELAFLVLAAADVVDRCSFGVSVALVCLKEMGCVTFRQNLPLARFRATIRRHGLIEIFKKILHLTSPLSLCELVANAQLWRPAVVASCTWRVHVFVLQVVYHPMLHSVVMSADLI